MVTVRDCSSRTGLCHLPGQGPGRCSYPDRVSRSVISAAFAASLDCHGRLPRSEVLTTSAL